MWQEVQTGQLEAGQKSSLELILSFFGIIRFQDQLAWLMTTGNRGIGKSIHTPDQAAFCRLLVGARTSAGLTQHAVALRLKKPQSFVAKYEGGERRVDVLEFVIIARALGAEPLKLLAAFLKGSKDKAVGTKARTRGKKAES